MITDKIINFLKTKYKSIIIKDEDNIISMFHSEYIGHTNIEINNNIISIPKIKNKDSNEIYSFNINEDKVLSENEILFTGFYLIENCLSKGLVYDLTEVNKINIESVNTQFTKFFQLLNTKGIVCNTIIYDWLNEICFSVFTDDKTGLTGYIIHENKLFFYSVDIEKLNDLYDYVNTSKNVNILSPLNATDEIILKSYFENNGFFSVCDLLHDYDFNSLSYTQTFIKIEKVLKSESRIINDLVINNQLSLYEED